MGSLVVLEADLVAETVAAPLTIEGLFARVGPLVRPQRRVPAEGALAHLAGEGLVGGVHLLVGPEVLQLGKAAPARLALVRLVPAKIVDFLKLFLQRQRSRVLISS